MRTNPIVKKIIHDVLQIKIMSDLSKLLHDDAIERQAEIIRRQLNLWVGVCLDNGQIQWMGADQCVDKPFCDRCLAEGGKCRQTYGTWFEKHAVTPTASNYHLCHAGLRGIAVPLFLSGQCHALLFASGFVFEGDAAPETSETPVVLTRREARIVLEMLTEMGQQIQDKMNRDRSGVVADHPQPAFDRNRIIGVSPAIQEIVRCMDDVCRSDAPVLLTGPEGSGRSFLAEMIHRNSARQNAPFVSMNCREFSDDALESEWFGYRRGAYIGAMAEKTGLFDVAGRGTLFLQNVDALSAPMQTRLKHTLESKSYLPRGDSMQREFDVRVISSSSRPLSDDVESGAFSRDLYYLLNVFEMAVPSLAQRREDIPLLASYLLAKACSERGLPQKQLSGEVIERFREYAWPGNVRELENEIEHILAQPSHDNLITAEHLSFRIRGGMSLSAGAILPPDVDVGPALPPGQTLPETLESIERQMIAHALRQNGGNRTRTAEILGMSRRNLIRKIENLHIED